MVAAHDFKELGTRNELRKLRAGTGDNVLAASRDQNGNPDGCKLVRRDLLARAPHASSERLEVAAGPLRERAEAARRVVGDVLDPRGFERLGDRPRPHHAAHQIDTDPGKYGASYSLRMREQQEG